ncbi:LacI family DNA-binding transcriptional regulator [Enterococcus casseliflavus]|uniref:LacI family DNA-binding transcriptional regulator n=1 Tax=Enterococcus casseliflavus TaxID=37734 RepID=UPI0022E7D18B|nr:LacI family DNA-binding transcriptional regulator [Enterococcus casseliflavus]
MATKLTDVAKLAGVSATTVSRVINNYGHLSQKTIDKVHAAMRELNYQPNSLARSLQGKKSQMIGVIFPSVRNPFFGELIERIEKHLFNRNYKMILCNSENDPVKEKEYLMMLGANQVDGIITGSHNLGIHEYEKLKAHIISFDRDFGKGIPIVASDNFSGGKIATQALIDSNAKEIGIITGSNESNSPTKLRLEGYLSALESKNLEPRVFEFKSNVSSTLKKMEIQRILRTETLDAVFCTDDLTALMVINAATEMGKKVPEDLKIVGYDGTFLIQQYSPNLSTILQPIDELATLLVELITRKIEEPEFVIEDKYILPVKLLHSETI